MSAHTHHEIEIDAPGAVVYRILANAAAWPQHFAPTIHVEARPLGENTERLSIWANARGEVKSWTSVRELNPNAGRISFRQEVSSPPVAAMRGEWIVEANGPNSTRLVLTHDFSAIDDDPAGLEWIHSATDQNSKTELANIKALAERWDDVDEIVFSFSDTTEIEAPLEAVYDFLYDASRWPDRLPHVTRLDLTEDLPNQQVMVMDTLAKDGSVHTTESVRICYPGDRIVYKQLKTPSLMAAHVGRWVLEQLADGVVRATSWHTVTVRVENIANVLGPDATVADARDFIRRAAGGNSAQTLRLTKEFAEAVHV